MMPMFSLTSNRTKLSEVRSAALQNELLLVYKGRAFQRKFAALMGQHLDPQAFLCAFKRLAKSTQEQVLSRYAVEPTDEGTGLIATAALEACLESPQAAALAALVWEAKVADAMDMLQELLTCFSSSGFQMDLNMLHRSHHPCSVEFGERFARLLAPVYAQVCPKYGFTADKQGMEDMTLAMGRVMCEVRVQALATSIDSVLYGATMPQARVPGPNVCCGRCLEKPQVMRLLREQLAAFSDPNFQHEVASLQGSKHADASSVAAERAQLALAVLRRILPKFGLEGSQRGAHTMLQLCAPHVWDPEVARLTWGIHFMLGADEPDDFVRRLRCIQAEMPPLTAGS